MESAWARFVISVTSARAPSEATLGFLGLGDRGAISWGMLAAQAQGLLRVAWWLALFPGLAIALTVIGVNLLADAAGSAGATG